MLSPYATRLPVELLQRLRRRAEREGRSQSAILRDALHAYLEGMDAEQRGRDRALAEVRRRLKGLLW